MNLENRVAVITGATGGLGSVVTRDLATRGASLALLDINPKRLAALTGDLSLPESRLFTQAVDLLHPAETQSAAQSILEFFGKVDILLHLVVNACHTKHKCRTVHCIYACHLTCHS